MEGGAAEGVAGRRASLLKAREQGSGRPPSWDGVSFHSGRSLEGMEVFKSERQCGKSVGQIEPPLPEAGRSHEGLMGFDHDAVRAR